MTTPVLSSPDSDWTGVQSLRNSNQNDAQRLAAAAARKRRIALRSHLVSLLSLDRTSSVLTAAVMFLTS
jgi:hypothetical protein